LIAKFIFGETSLHMKKNSYIQVIKIYKIEPNRTFDCTGLRCPEPVFKARIEIDKIPKGQILEFIADDPAAEEDIKSLVKRLGQELLDIRKDGAQLHFFIRKIK